MSDWPRKSNHVANEAGSIYDPAFVKGVFDRCSERYIAFSYFCSFGFTERWRRQCVKALPSPAPNDPIGYDLMAGTGEAWPHLFKAHKNVRRITAVDISPGMHKRAIERLHKLRSHKIEFIEDDVFRSGLPDESADFVISTFGLKTFDNAQLKKLAELTMRVLKPGGTFSFIEASDPKGWPLRPAYLFHLKTVLPFIEKILLRGAQDFAMIGTYSNKFGDASQFASMLSAHGLIVNFRPYFFGCATGVSGVKPVKTDTGA